MIREFLYERVMGIVLPFYVETKVEIPLNPQRIRTRYDH